MLEEIQVEKLKIKVNKRSWKTKKLILWFRTWLRQIGKTIRDSTLNSIR